ncbi:MAG: nucleotidyltransferase domain-containing protein [Bdellovibrionales bacterium]|nr:nucleotidyltransferase domain-containing protein [Bdellovibrionales bacterium]
MRAYSNIARLLFTSDLRARLLGVLLLEPERRFYVRELSRHLEASHGTIHRELTALSDSGLLLREEEAGRVYYKANTAISIYEELAGLLRKTVGLVDVIAEALRPLERKIVLAFIYGSEARGEAEAGSDIDLMVVADLDELRLHKQLQNAEERLGRPVNYTLYSEKEFKKKAKEQDSFVQQVISGEILPVIGVPDDLRRAT